MKCEKNGNSRDGVQQNLIVSDLLNGQIQIFVDVMKNKVHDEAYDGEDNNDDSSKHASLCLTAVDGEVIGRSIVNVSVCIFQ